MIAKTRDLQQTTGPQTRRIHNRIGLFGLDWTYEKPRKTPWYRKVREMRCCATIALLRTLFVAPLMSTDFVVEAEQGTPDEIVDFVRAEWQRHWKELVRNAGFGCLDFGWQPFEPVWQNRKGQWRINRFKPLLQDFTEIVIDEEHGDFLGFTQSSFGYAINTPTNELRVENDAALLINFNQEGTDWYGQAPMKAVEDTYDRQNTLYHNVGLFDARLAASHWVIYYPIGRTPVAVGQETMPPSGVADGKADNAEIAERIMKVLLATGSCTLPSHVKSEMEELQGYGEWKIELLSSAQNAASAPYGDRLRYYDSLMARGLGFPERAVFEGQHGTKAESETQTDTAMAGFELYTHDICRGINRFNPALILNNFGETHQDAVTISPSPMKDEVKAFYRELYGRFLDNEEIKIEEYDHTPMDIIREKLGVPFDPDHNDEATGHRGGHLEGRDDDLLDDEGDEELELAEDCGAGSGAGGGFGKGNTCAKGGGDSVESAGVKAVNSPYKQEGYDSKTYETKAGSIVITDRGVGTYVVKLNGKEIAKADLESMDSKDFFTNIRVHKEYRRKGVATAIYDYVESRLGYSLRESPHGLTDDGKAFREARKKQLNDITLAERST